MGIGTTMASRLIVTARANGGSSVGVGVGATGGASPVKLQLVKAITKTIADRAVANFPASVSFKQSKMIVFIALILVLAVGFGNNVALV